MSEDAVPILDALPSSPRVRPDLSAATSYSYVSGYIESDGRPSDLAESRGEPAAAARITSLAGNLHTTFSSKAFITVAGPPPRGAA
jgi:hypothetical protein